MTEQDYLKVWNDLFDLATKMGFMPNDKKCYEEYLSNLGWIKKSPLRKNCGKKYRVKQLGEYFKNKTVIIHTTKHLTAIIDGCMHDSWDCREWCANSYFTKD